MKISQLTKCFSTLMIVFVVDCLALIQYMAQEVQFMIIYFFNFMQAINPLCITTYYLPEA